MGKKTKIGLLCALLAIVMTVGTLALMYYVLQVPVFDRSGWVWEQDGIRYLNYYAEPVTGWQQINGNRHYFHPSGKLAAGMVEIDGKTYLLSGTGSIQTGWVRTKGKQYYLNPDGTVFTGWLELENQRYYLNSDGVMQTGWLELGDDRYYLAEDGAAFTGWLQTDLAHYYMDAAGKMQTGNVWIDGFRHYFLPAGEYVPLVNPWNPMVEEYTPVLTDLEDYQIDASCRDALQRMLEGCRAAGYECHINSAYRDETKQQQLWDRQYTAYIEDGKSPEEAQTLTAEQVAVPGTSEHHLGLAVDLGGSKGVYDWLEAHCWEYGFIRRYPEGKTEVTGIIYEPWHYRYLGQNLAKSVFDSGLTLEEYFLTLE